MGLIAKSAKKISDKHKDFEPIDLSEGNVQAIFNRCVVSENTENSIRNNLIF